jgi:hypothetical protein
MKCCDYGGTGNTVTAPTPKAVIISKFTNCEQQAVIHLNLKYKSLAVKNY